MLAISSFFTWLVDKLIDILLKILTNLSQWLYNIQVNRYSKNLPSIEVIDINSKFDINELSQNDLINKKNELKGQLWESLGVKPADNHWYNNSYIVGGLVLGSLIILGGAYYYFIIKNNDVPVVSNPRPEISDDYSIIWTLKLDLLIQMILNCKNLNLVIQF